MNVFSQGLGLGLGARETLQNYAPTSKKGDLQKWVILMSWWARQYLLTSAVEEAAVTEATACLVY